MLKKTGRFIYMILLGIGVSFLLSYITKSSATGWMKFFDILTSIFITVLVWEGNLRIDKFINNRFPWQKSPVKRIAIQLPISLFYTTLIMFYSMVAFNNFICIQTKEVKESFIKFPIIIGTLVTFAMLTIEISMQFFQKWKDSLIEVEKYKTESTQAQLQNLKNQINPHFLFNNMSVLSSLVYKDQDKAVDFINQLSKVYRYLLDNKDKELVSLKDELTFIKSYTYLLKIRFDSNINFDFAISSISENKLLPPMALQILIENAIKHNEISNEQPLTVTISSLNDEQLEVRNNIYLRSVSEPSNKSGLPNIIARYSFFTEKPIEIIDDSKTFIVKLPLLNSK